MKPFDCTSGHDEAAKMISRLKHTREYLAGIMSMSPSPPVFARVLQDFGVEMAPIKTRRSSAPARQCYRNALEIALAQRDHNYMEGLGLAATINHPIPLSHAWIRMPDGSVFDPTWGDEPGNEYIGVEFDTDFLVDFMCRTRTVSVFESLYMLRMSPDAAYDYVVSGIVKRG